MSETPDGLMASSSTASSDSFWEPNNYRNTTRRIDDGFKLTTDLVRLVQERADIERRYGKSLTDWASKWTLSIQKGPEYGSLERAWLGLLEEGERRGELQQQLRQMLLDQVVSVVRGWQKEHYHRSVVLGSFKERKELDEAFKKAQKPWLKLYTRVQKCKEDYYAVCRALKSAITAERNSAQDASVSEEQRRRANEKVERCKESVENARSLYQTSIDDLNNYNAKYMEDMTEVFDKCQRVEEDRLHFFRSTLMQLQETLNCVKDDSLKEIYSQVRQAVSVADVEQDLRWWSNHRGVNMGMRWPSFEEYTEQFRDIRGKGTKANGVDNVDNGVTLINQRSTCDDLPPADFLRRPLGTRHDDLELDGHKCRSMDIQQASHLRQVDGHLRRSGKKSPTPSTLPRTTGATKKSAATSSSMSSGPVVNGTETHSDDEFEHSSSVVKVRALYHYEALEDDELNLAEGEEFERLQDEDEQGWCTGRKDGKVGLYPSTYAVVV